ncbi:MAG: dihydrodipicolinate reductase [Patescibacteria group bacterium]|nr:dihydrodipicolinate reductase [Patescibacteria group bacterium]
MPSRSELTTNKPEAREIPESRTPILISGFPGKMAKLIAEAVVQSKNLVLCEMGLSCDTYGGTSTKIKDKWIDLQLPCQHEATLRGLKNNIIVVDFTVPTAVNRNAELYASVGIPFVMGTTGGDRVKLVETVKNSEICAVIAPNMAPHMVIMQALIEKTASEFPDALSGWQLAVTESHQATKKDVSGTARAWSPKLELLGAHLAGDIISIRDPQEQAGLGIQELEGHGYHWFELKSPDGKASLKISTAVEGRSPYVDGTLMAINFLEKRIKEGARGQVYSMVDVLKAQAA